MTKWELMRLIEQSIRVNFGQWGFTSIGEFRVIYFSSSTSTGILRVHRHWARLLWAALTYISEIKGDRVIVQVVRMSGTIRKIHQHAIAFAEEEVRAVTHS